MKIRPIQVDEIPEAVTVHQAAFPGFFLSFLGSDFLNLLYRFYALGETEVALVAACDQWIVGAIIGTINPHGFYGRLARRYFAGFAWASMKPLLKRPNIFPRLVKALLYRGDSPCTEGNGALLASVCVDPSVAGKGIGRELVMAFESGMWARGASFIYLTTDRDDNVPTQRFYEKMGWAVESEFFTAQGRAMRRYWKKAPCSL